MDNLNRESHLLSQQPALPESSRKVPSGVKDLLDLVLTSLEDTKAENINPIDLAGKTTIADFMVVASGRSQRQVSAIADHLVQALKASGHAGPRVEGLPQADWVLVDAGDIVVHIFRPEVRDFYNLEKMWAADLTVN